MISDDMQLTAVNIVIEFMPRGRIPQTSAQCGYLADCLGAARDRCAKAQMMSETYALDDIIAALRRGLAPPKSDCARLAKALGVVRDRMVQAKASAEKKDAKARRAGDIRAVMDADRRRR